MFAIVPPNTTEEIEPSEASTVEMQEDAGKLTCPICSVEYERTPENARNLVLHVDEHLVEELKCPVCFIVFNINNQNAYENHVNVSRFFSCTKSIKCLGLKNIFSGSEKYPLLYITQF